MDRKALAAAFPVTVPVLMGYLAIGMAFGFMLQAIGYNFILSLIHICTIADLDGAKQIGVEHLAEAIQYRESALLRR